MELRLRVRAMDNGTGAKERIRYGLGRKDMTIKEMEEYKGTFLFSLSESAKKHKKKIQETWGHKSRFE